MTDLGRRRDPQPLNRQGEVALVVVAGVLFALTWVALGGMGVAASLFGGGWAFPQGGTGMASAMAGLLTGHPGRGLPPSLAARVPGDFAVYGCVAVAGVLAIVVAVCAAVMVARYRRPGDARRGMATRYEASQVLGIGRLRQARPIIRPDLDVFPAHRSRPINALIAKLTSFKDWRPR